MPILLLSLFIGGCSITERNSENMGSNTVIFETNHGDIKIELYEDMNITAGNFKKLVNEGFYDGVIFHRVISGFMVQGGDPEP